MVRYESKQSHCSDKQVTPMSPPHRGRKENDWPKEKQNIADSCCDPPRSRRGFPSSKCSTLPSHRPLRGPRIVRTWQSCGRRIKCRRARYKYSREDRAGIAKTTHWKGAKAPWGATAPACRPEGTKGQHLHRRLTSVWREIRIAGFNVHACSVANCIRCAE